MTNEMPFSLHKLAVQGHIEDIAIKKEMQGKKFGVRLIQALDFVAEKVGCYKACPHTTHCLSATDSH
jgi:glucosamine-phosphate N-acetyltransferase